MKVFPKQSAKHFSVYDVQGRRIQLEDFKGKRILLSFFRNVACPFCNLQIHRLKKASPQLKDRLEMLFVFESDKQIIERSIFHQEMFPVPIISDPQKDLYALYGVESSPYKTFLSMLKRDFQHHARMAKKLGLDFKVKEKGSTIIPADFLIDENLSIQVARYGKSIHDHMSIEEISDFAQAELRA